VVKIAARIRYVSAAFADQNSMPPEKLRKLVRREVKLKVGFGEKPRFVGYHQNGAAFFGRDTEFVDATCPCLKCDQPYHVSELEWVGMHKVDGLPRSGLDGDREVGRRLWTKAEETKAGVLGEKVRWKEPALYVQFSHKNLMEPRGR